MRMDQLPTPCYVENLKILAGVMEETGCRILLAQKAFSAYGLYPLIGKYLNGTTASGLFEARLGRQEMALHPELRERNLETHVFSAAYREDEFQEIAGLCDHVVFNSFAQLEKFRDTARKMGAGIGLRIKATPFTTRVLPVHVWGSRQISFRKRSFPVWRDCIFIPSVSRMQTIWSGR